MSSLGTHMEASIAAAKETVARMYEKRGWWHPMAFVSARKDPTGEAKEGGVIEMALDLGPVFDSANDAVGMLREVVTESHAAQVIIAVESWMLVETNKDALAKEIEAANKTGIEKHPGRVEAIVLYVAREGGAGLVWLSRISRAKDGRPTLREWERVDGLFGGAFADLFPPKASA